MSYKNDKEQMNNEMSLHKKRVMLAIKITFLVLAVALVTFAISFARGLGKGELFASQRDTEPPTISAREGTTVIGYLGESPTFKKYVLVSDDKDEEPKLAIDSKSVNTEKEGSYTVYYQAKDSAGNKSSVFSLTYVVKNNEYSRDALMKKIAKIAGDLGISKDMSTVEKVRRIYKFVNKEIGWSGGIGESNIPGIPLIFFDISLSLSTRLRIFSCIVFLCSLDTFPNSPSTFQTCDHSLISKSRVLT